MLKMNEEIRKLNQLYEELEDLEITYQLCNLSSSASIYDLLLAATGSFAFLEKSFMEDEYFQSNSLEEKYFSMYDIRSFLNYNVSYRLGSEFFVKTVDKYVLDGKILTLNNQTGLISLPVSYSSEIDNLFHNNYYIV